jgi:hypothetical protein
MDALRRRRSICAGLATLTVVTFLAGTAFAQPKPASVALPSSAISTVTAALAQGLAQAPKPALFAGAILVSDAPAPRATELVASLVTQVAGRLGPGMRTLLAPADLAEARQAAKDDRAVVHLHVRLAAGKLRVTADVYPVPRGVWGRLRDPAPGPIAHAFAEAPIDAEVRTFLRPIPLVAANVIRGKNFENDVVALACADLDGDGSPEIIAVGRRRISVERLRGGHVVPALSRNWPDLMGVASAPLREPLAFATAIDADGPSGGALLDVALTDRDKSIRLDAGLQLVATMPGLAVPDAAASACTRVGALTLTGPLGPCAPGDRPPLLASFEGHYDAFASARLVSKEGAAYAAWVGRENGVLELRDDTGRKARIESVGAQLALGDLDQDGEPEIVGSLDTSNPLEDAVVVWTWVRASTGATLGPKEVLRIPAPAGVRAVAVCPPDGPGVVPFLVATSDEIWVVR